MSKKPTKLIPAVAYLRKSTAEAGHEKSIEDQLKRINKLKPTEHGAEYVIVRVYDKDKGVPGWKRGAKRPDYFKLVEELGETKAKAILIDDMDRFSRADEMETVSDVQHLRELGVRYVHAVNQGCKDLVQGEFVAMRIAMDANASHAFSQRLSRRIAEARLDLANAGKRSGGPAPYGMEHANYELNRHGDRVPRGVKPGDPKHVKVVRQIFRWFVRDDKSMNWIADTLNERKVPASRGGLWHPATVKELLQRREYRGDFTYNQKKAGQFHIVNKKHEVVPVQRYQDEHRQPWKKTMEGAFLKPKAYKPIIAPDVWDAAQKRIATFGIGGSRRRREDVFVLAGILICDHCNRFMYGCEPKRGKHSRVYRCSARSKQSCPLGGKPELHEAYILPKILRALGEKIKDITELRKPVPKSLRNPNEHSQTAHKQLQRERDKLAAKLSSAEDDWLKVSDPRMRASLEKRMVTMHDELDRLDAELMLEVPANTGYTANDLAKLRQWWEDFDKRAVSVPVNQKAHDKLFFQLMQDPFADSAVLVDCRVAREALLMLGAEVRLRWKAGTKELADGTTRPIYTFLGGKFQLGQDQYRVKPGKDGVKLYKAQFAARCSDNRAADRCDSRRGTG